MGDQPVEIVDYDPRWADRFTGQRERLSSLLEPWLAASVEHIGSTSVRGLRAKPVVDVLAPVASLAGARDAVAVLEGDGWLLWPDDPGRQYRLWFLRPRPEARTHHLQVIAYDDPHARALLAFRDALRSDPHLARRYAVLKDRLAAQHRADRNAYTNAKGDFVEQVLRKTGVNVPVRVRLPEWGDTAPSPLYHA